MITNLEKNITKSLIYALFLHTLTTWFSAGQVLLTATIVAAVGFIIVSLLEEHED